MGSCHQRPSIGRCDHQIDQPIDSRVLNADEIAAPRSVGSATAPVIALFVARRQGLRQRNTDHIVVEILDPIFVLRRIDNTNAGLDADLQ